MALRSTSLSSPIVPNCLRSSSGCGTDDCGRTSGPSRPSTMPSPPSTRPSGARGRRSFVFVRENGETATDLSHLVFLVTWSAFDRRHVPCIVALAGGGREVVQPFDLRGAQLDAVGGRVFLDAGDPLGAGDRGDVVALREQPGQSYMCGRRPHHGRNRLHLDDDAQVALA